MRINDGLKKKKEKNFFFLLLNFHIREVLAHSRIHGYMCPLSTLVPNFNLLGVTVPEKSVTKNFKVWKLERKKNEEIKGQISSSSSLILIYTWYICPLSMCVPSINLSGLAVSEKSVTKNFNNWRLERKKNEEIKGQISSSSMIPVYMIHLPTVHMWTMVQPSRPYSFWEKCDKEF